MRKFRWMTFLASASVMVGYGLQHLHTATTFGHDAHKRGRYAETPLHMTWLGWKDVFARTWTEATDDRLISVAASVAFFTLLALVPGLSVVVSIYGLFTEPSQIYTHIAAFSSVLPTAGREIVEDQARRLTSQPPAALSLNLMVSLAVAAWSANAAIKGMFEGLNVIYGEMEKRSFVKFNLISLATTFAALGLMILAMFIIAVLPHWIETSPFPRRLEWAISIFRWPAFFAIAVMAICVLYWIGPSRAPARWPWILPGAIVAALVWAGVSALFSWYVSTLADYTATYGSLSAIIVFMTWLWLSAAMILLGAELNAELEHQTAQDTTTGAPKPLGMRGAVVADHVAPPTVRG